MIQIQDLRFSYPTGPVPALDSLSLSVKPGSLFGLLGPNGSGKTTLLSLLNGLLPAPEGAVSIGGLSLTKDLAAIQAFSSLVPQEYAFYPRLSVAENLRFFAGVQAIPASLLPGRLDAAIEATQLGAFLKVRGERLSGGLKRRLNIAIGLLNQPRLLYLDEPAVGIDPQSRAFILEAVRRINRQGTTVVYTTHYMDEVESLCDQIAVLDHGRVLVKGSLDELFANPSGHPLLVSFEAPLTSAQHAALGPVIGGGLNERGLSLPACDEERFRKVMDALRGAGVRVARVKFGHGNLEDLFLHLTHRTLRDA